VLLDLGAVGALGDRKGLDGEQRPRRHLSSARRAATCAQTAASSSTAPRLIRATEATGRSAPAVVTPTTWQPSMPGTCGTHSSISAGLTRKPPRRSESPMRVRNTKRPSGVGVAEVAGAVPALRVAGPARWPPGCRQCSTMTEPGARNSSSPDSPCGSTWPVSGSRARTWAGRRARRAPARAGRRSSGGGVFGLAREERLDLADAVQAQHP
jgi:hypothetical protein